MDVRLECSAGCPGIRSYQSFLGDTGCARSDRRKGPKSRRCVLFLWYLGLVQRSRGPAHTVSRRDLGKVASGATHLAYVLRMVYRYGFLLPGSAAGLSRVVAGVDRSFDTSIF